MQVPRGMHSEGGGGSVLKPGKYQATRHRPLRIDLLGRGILGHADGSVGSLDARHVGRTACAIRRRTNTAAKRGSRRVEKAALAVALVVALTRFPSAFGIALLSPLHATFRPTKRITPNRAFMNPFTFGSFSCEFPEPRGPAPRHSSDRAIVQRHVARVAVFAVIRRLFVLLPP